MMKELLKLTVLVFMAGNLFDMGLRLSLGKVAKGMQRRRFVLLSLLWGFVLLPLLAWLLGHLLPLSPEHAVGLLLLGMAPCAPFLPPMIDRARGNLDLGAVVMLVTAVVTVVYMVVMVPILARGLAVTAVVIAKPLVLFMLLPLLVGVAVKMKWPESAASMHRPVKIAVAIDTLLLIALCFVIYGRDFLDLFGSYVPLAEIVFFAVAAVGPVLLPLGLVSEEGVVLSLAMATRNLGAALAPLFAANPVPQQAVVAVALGMVMQTTASLIVATVFGRTARLQRAPVDP